MLNRVADCISRYSMFARGQAVGVAVSGGADSVALLHVLLELAPRWALRLSVLHLDHRLRGEESDGDAAFVENIARELGLPLHCTRVDVGAIRLESGGNLEQAARLARREFFLKLVAAGTLDRIATGHTRSDQAETVLLRLLRGSGTSGMVGILPVTREGLVRPLLDVDREEVERFLTERELRWREDSSNRDLAFARNRVRHQLLPALVRDFNPALPRVLAHTATLVLDEELYWEREMDRLGQEFFTGRPPAVLLNVVELRAFALPVARRLVRRAIREARGDLLGIEFSHIEDVLRIAEEKKEGHGRVRLPGLEVVRSFDWLRLAPLTGTPARGYRLPLGAPGSVRVPGTGSRVEVYLGGRAEVGDGLDWGRVPQPLELRNWRPGDQYRLAGRSGPIRIKELFQRHKVPLWERGSWPVVTGGNTVLWSRRFGPTSDFAAGPGAPEVLRIEETQDLRDSWDPKHHE